MELPNGIYLIYIKDDTAYPVGLTKEQAELLPTVLQALGTIKVFSNKPMGRAENLTKGTVEK